MKTTDAHETQISAFISKIVKARLEKLVRTRGLKKGFVIERALEHHLQALQEIPEEFIIPPTLVVTTNGADRRVHTTDPLAELNRIAATSSIDAFQMERPTLEQVFLSLTGRSLRD